uniref:Predicted protein n=1 Tax=Physcomitrium patens TaxID=3218 RepID=A9U6Y6_PHYPA
MKVTGNPLTFLQLHQFGNPLIRILQLYLKLPSFVPIICGDRQQNHRDQTDQNERNLGNHDGILRHIFIIHRNHCRNEMNRIQRNESNPVMNISDKERNEEREIDISEDQRHGQGYQNLNGCPKIQPPALGYKRQHIAAEERQNHQGAKHHMNRGRRTKYEVKRENIKDDPYIRTKSCAPVENLVPFLQGRCPPDVRTIVFLVVYHKRGITALFPLYACSVGFDREAVKSEPVKEKAKKEEPVKSEAAKGEQKAESTKGVQMNTSMEIGGKHGVGVSASGQMDSTGVSTQAGTHVGGESYGLGVQGEAGVSGSHGLSFDTGAQLGGKYGLGVHADGHVGIKQGIGLNTEAQLGGDHGVGAYVNSQVGGGQGAGVSAGAHVGGDHGLGAHAGAQVGGGKGVSFKVGGNVGSHDGELGLNFGGSDKKKS